MKVLLVAYEESTVGPLKKLFRTAEYPIVPRIDDVIEYQDGWALSGVDYIYVCFNYIEIKLKARFGHENAETLKSLGWVDDLGKLNQSYFVGER